MAVIRDFIYLDIERVRSFYTQINGGIPTESQTVEETHESTGGSARAGIPGLGGDVRANFQYRRMDSETYSLHDQILVELLSGLVDEKLVIELSDNFEWNTQAFTDGMFVLTQGPIKIVDHQYVISQLAGLPQLAKSIDAINKSNSNESSQSSRGGNSKKRNQSGKSKSNKLTGMLDSKQVTVMASLFDQTMQDSLRLKIYPDAQNRSNHFVATADKSLFRYNTASLISLYGTVVDAGWKSLLQVNKGEKQDLHPVQLSELTDMSSLETAVEYFSDHLFAVTELMQGVKFPVVAATPIAVFREI